MHDVDRDINQHFVLIRRLFMRKLPAVWQIRNKTTENDDPWQSSYWNVFAVIGQIFDEAGEPSRSASRDGTILRFSTGCTEEHEHLWVQGTFRSSLNTTHTRRETEENSIENIFPCRNNIRRKMWFSRELYALRSFALGFRCRRFAN